MPRGSPPDEPGEDVSTIHDHPGLHLEIVRPGPGLVCLRGSGEIDYLTAPRLSEILSRALVSGPPLVVALDLGDIGFCSVAGLTVLLEAKARADATGCSVTFDRLSRPLRRIIGIAGLHRELARRVSEPPLDPFDDSEGVPHPPPTDSRGAR